MRKLVIFCQLQHKNQFSTAKKRPLSDPGKKKIKTLLTHIVKTYNLNEDAFYKERHRSS